MRLVLRRLHVKLLQTIGLTMVVALLLFTSGSQRDIRCYGDQCLEEPTQKMPFPRYNSTNIRDGVKQRGNHKKTIILEKYKDHMVETVEGPWQRSTHLKSHLREACKTLQPKQDISIDLLNRILVDEDREILYCYVPKIGCTSWKRVWMKIQGLASPGDDVWTIPRLQVHTAPLPTLLEYHKMEIKSMLSSYRKFFFVRRPWERVVAAYRDKLEIPTESIYDFHKEIGAKIENKYRGTTNSTGDTVTFPEFISYISEEDDGSPEQNNEHWKPALQLCAPCLINYDFIGRFESLEEDSNFVLDWLNLRDLVPLFPSATMATHSKHHSPRYRAQLEPGLSKQFLQKYMDEFIAFKYDLL